MIKKCSRRFSFGAVRRTASCNGTRREPAGTSEAEASATLGWCHQSGTTLVELVMTIVIISIAIAGVVGAFALITGRSADPLNQTRAVALAQLYMEEALSKRYDRASPPGGFPPYGGTCRVSPQEGTDRESYSIVDDYDAIDNASPQNADEVPLSDYNGFRVSVTVRCVDSSDGLGSVDAKRITIDISAPGNQNFTFAAYKANF